jgi:FkbM family methyltransferase
MSKVIYDFGSNNGDDIPYYLKKASLVVAVEANPALAEHICARFKSAISLGQLVVLNCVIVKDEMPGELVPFYVHKTNHVLSQFPKPPPGEIDQFDRLLVPSQRASKIIQTYGVAHYVKIDVEHYDQVILEEIFAAGIRPEFISAESHDIDVFATLISLGRYRSFKLVEGPNVARDFFKHLIATGQGEELYSFPHHSAGPFGSDIPGPWLSANSFFYLLAYRQLGWKDIHATDAIEPDTSIVPAASVRRSLRLLSNAVLHQVRSRKSKWWGGA